MSSDKGAENPGVAELRAIWVMAGILALILSMPWTPLIVVAHGIPWLLTMAMLARRHTAFRCVVAWHGVVSSRAGVLGVVGLVLAVYATGVLIDPSAGLLLAIWLFFAGTSVGLLRGPVALIGQVAGWAVLAIVGGGALFAVEGLLRWTSVAERVGTPHEVGKWELRYDSLWDRNVLGIRSPYEVVRKEPGVLRIVAIGDSYTWGDKIASSDSTWPARLESELQRRVPRSELEVVNLGRNGFTIANSAELLRRLGWQFEPDIVVAQFYLNDILPSGPDFQREYSEWLFPRAWILPERYRGGPLGSSALLHLAEGALTALRHGDRAEQASRWTELYREQGPEWTAVENALAEMGSAAAEKDVPIVLMLFPDFGSGVADEAHLPFRDIHRLVADVAQDAGFSILDLTDAYLREGEDLSRWWATPYDAHPNEAAAGVAARTLADHLVEWLDLESL